MQEVDGSVPGGWLDGLCENDHQHVRASMCCGAGRVAPIYDGERLVVENAICRARALDLMRIGGARLATLLAHQLIAGVVDIDAGANIIA